MKNASYNEFNIPCPMETFYSIAINFILFSIFMLSFIGGEFSFIVVAKRLLLNATSIILMVLPLFLFYNKIVTAYDLSALTTIGLCLYPISLTLMIQQEYTRYQYTVNIPIYLISAASFFMLMVFPDYTNLIIFIVYLFLYIYLLYLIFPGRRDATTAIFVVIIFLNIVYISVTVYTLESIHFIISSGLMSIFTALLLSYNIKNKIEGLITQFNAINELNKKLSHRIARLKQSNDQSRKIIIEKDLEIYQMARHASLAELTTGIAHELTQPLTGIKGIAQNMIDDINDEEFENLQAVSELLRICSLVDKSSSIIDHIRNFSKKNILSMKHIDLNKVILDAIDLIQLQLKKKNIDLIFILDETIPKIHGDKISLEQLIVNIILNSKDAILEKDMSDKETGTISINTFADANAVTIIIHDNGSGISEDIMQKIWSPFFTTKKRDRGTGIGLSICNKILKDHNASVDIKSGIDGTQFTFRFPIAISKE